MKQGWDASSFFYLEWKGQHFRLPDSLNELAEDAELKSSLPSLLSFLKSWYAAAPIQQKTSGSTGEPRFQILERERMVASALRSNAFFGITENSRILVCLGVDYIAGKMQLMRALCAGATAVVIPPIADPLSQVEGAFDFVSMVPQQFRNSRRDWHRVKKLLLGGAPLQAGDEAMCQDLGDTRVWVGYGMTETYSHVALRALGDPTYRAMQGVRFAMGKSDNLIVKDAVLKAEWATTDRVVLENDHSFRWLGRTDFVINSGGIKIQPEPIEHQLSSACENALLLIGVPDTHWGERAVLLVEGSLHPTALTSLKKALHQLPAHVRPKSIHHGQTFVRTWNGKLHRMATRERFLQA